MTHNRRGAWSKALSVVGLALVGLILVPDVAVAVTAEPTPSISQQLATSAPSPVETSSPTPSPTPAASQTPAASPTSLAASPAPASSNLAPTTEPVESHVRRQASEKPNRTGNSLSSLSLFPLATGTISGKLSLIATALTPTFTPTTLLKPGVMLTANAGTAPTGATVKGYQWSRATTSTGVFTNIPDATLNTYTLTGADAAKYLKVTVIWSKAGNADTPKLSAATMLIAVGTFATTATPTITGSVNVGSTVTANEGAWSPTPDSYTYKWYISTTAAGTCTLISGATNRTYLVASGDVNKFLKVEITAVKTGYTTSVAFRSAATAAVGPALPQ